MRMYLLDLILYCMKTCNIQRYNVQRFTGYVDFDRHEHEEGHHNARAIIRIRIQIEGTKTFNLYIRSRMCMVSTVFILYVLSEAIVCSYTMHLK